jgi:two-component system, NarL family, response regulator NreC
MRIVLIAGEPVFRMGWRRMVEASADLQLVGDAGDARAGFREVDRAKPDVVVVDIALGGMNGIAATREIRCRAPEARVLLLASWPRERDALDGFAAGARGFALKTQPTDALLGAVRSVGHGHVYVAPELRGLRTEDLGVHRERQTPDAPDVLGPLSPREREVLDLVIKGWRNRQIARELCVSIKTVDTHRTRINRKLQCGSSADLIRFAAENDLLRLAPSLTPLPESVPASASSEREVGAAGPAVRADSALSA